MGNIGETKKSEEPDESKRRTGCTIEFQYSCIHSRTIERNSFPMRPFSITSKHQPLSLVYKKSKQTTQTQNNATSLFRLETDNARNTQQEQKH